VKFVSRKVAKAQSLRSNKVSLPRRSVGRAGFVGNVAKLSGPVCGGIFAAASVRACDQIRQSLARQVPLGAAEKIIRLVSAQRAVELGCGRNSDGCWPESQVVSACHRVVAQARGFPHHSGEPKKLAGVRLLARQSRRPRCEAAWPRLRAGFCCKSARACREIRHGSARQASSGVAKKAHGRASVWRAWPVISRWSNIVLASAGGRGILFSSPAKNVHHRFTFLPGCLVHYQIFKPFFRPAPDLRPYGEDSRPRWKQRHSEAGVVSLCASWPVNPPAPGAGR